MLQFVSNDILNTQYYNPIDYPIFLIIKRININFSSCTSVKASFIVYSMLINMIGEFSSTDV